MVILILKHIGQRETMENRYNKLLNSVIEICIVVGMDQDTGLVPAHSPEVPSIQSNNINIVEPELIPRKTRFITRGSSVALEISGCFDI